MCGWFCDRDSLFELLQQTLIWRPQHVVDLGHLVQLVGSREERIQAAAQRGEGLIRLGTVQGQGDAAVISPQDLEQDAAGAPDVHLQAVVSVGEEALRGSVPTGGDVLGVRRLGEHAAARAEVAQLQNVLLHRRGSQKTPKSSHSSGEKQGLSCINLVYLVGVHQV